MAKFQCVNELVKALQPIDPVYCFRKQSLKPRSRPRFYEKQPDQALKIRSTPEGRPPTFECLKKPVWPKSLFPIAWGDLSENDELALAFRLENIAHAHRFGINSGSRLKGIVMSHDYGVLALGGHG